jgi:Fe-S oxidoreductase
MCPSYMATKDEHDTTRGRANALRNALAGRIPYEQLYTPEMYGVMDLCLGCKACKSECPSAVDMARIKAEYLVHYYAHNGLPLFNRLMGMLPQLDNLLYKTGRPLIPVVNAVLASPLFKKIQARIGVHPHRTLPTYAPERFSDWFKSRPSVVRPKSPVAVEGERGQSTATNAVILFHDTWHEYNYTTSAKAAVKVLEAAGYQVYLAEGRACCGRPLITGGQADRARPWIDQNVALLAPYAAQGIPIVGIEPSCILTLRDEYLSLASDKDRATVLAKNAFLFEEFISRVAVSSGLDRIWRQTPGKVLLHGHCHQKALVGNEASVAALQLAGYDANVIPSGCCGMAGDFGYGIDHYEVSRQIGEDRLLPAVRAAAPDTLIVASGVSCRQQISHFSGRKAMHIAEALAAALKER